MRKSKAIASATLAFALVISLASCSKTNQGPINTTNPTDEPAPTPMETITNFLQDLDADKMTDTFLSNEFIKSNFDVESRTIRKVTYNDKTHNYYETLSKYYKGISTDTSLSESTELNLDFRDIFSQVPKRFLLTVLTSEENKEKAHTALYDIIGNYVDDGIVAKVKDVESKIDSTYYYGSEYDAGGGGVVKIEFRAEPTPITVSKFTQDDDADKQMEELKEAYAKQGAPQETLDGISADMFGTYTDSEETYTYYEVTIDFLDIPNTTFTSDMFLSGNELAAGKNIPGIKIEDELLKADFEELKGLFDASDIQIRYAGIITMEDASNIEIQVDAIAKSDGSTTNCYISGSSNGSYSINYKSGYYDTPCKAAEIVKNVALHFGITEKEAQLEFDNNADTLKNLKNTESKELVFSSDKVSISTKFTYIENYGYFVDYLIYSR